jgi:hypothetical protein
MLILSKKRANRGLGVNDVIISLVVASIIGILIYNLHKNYKNSREIEYANAYIRQNAQAALDAMVTDLVKSVSYASGCKETGLIKPLYGGIEKSDEITILTAEARSYEFLKTDLPNLSSQLEVNLGAPFTSDQKIMICDGPDSERFIIKQLSADQSKNILILLGEGEGENKGLKKTYPKDTIIGNFSLVNYHIDTNKEGSPTLFKKTEDGNLKPVANDIENLKFEYFTSDSTVPLPEPMDPKTIIGVRISVVARSKIPDPKVSGVNSLNGMPDNYDRLRISAKLDFSPVEIGKIKNLAFRFVPDKVTGNDFPQIFVEGSN